MRSRTHAVVAALAAWAVAVGCSADPDPAPSPAPSPEPTATGSATATAEATPTTEPAPGDLETQLTTQRDDVRLAVTQMLPLFAEDLSGRIVTARGSWQACDLDAEADAGAHYRVVSRLDIDGAADSPLQTRLADLLASEGFDIDETVTDGSVRAISPEFEVVVTTNAEDDAATARIALAGPCLAVPPADRAAWTDRDDPDGDLPLSD